MAKIELRKDGWFEAGKDTKDSFPVAYQAYQVKQMLQQRLTELSDRNLDRQSLQEALYGIEATRPFKRRPYLRGNDIIVDTHGLPGEAYLGSIVE